MNHCKLKSRDCHCVQTHYLKFLNIPVCGAVVKGECVISKLKKCPKGDTR